MIEGVAVAAAGAALGWFAGAWMHPAVGVVMAVIGGLNGAVGGMRRVYPWRRWSGAVGFVLDSTWACIPVATGLVAHAVAAVSTGEFVPASSERQGRHVYRQGLVFRKGYALTLGNVVSGAGDVDRPRRAKLVADHEGVHVWQARWLGPVYLVIYGVWAAVGAAAGLVAWLARGRREPLGHVVETCSYYLNPFEWWAYSRDANWPPSGACEGLCWRRPAVQSFEARRRSAAAAGVDPR